MMLCTLPSNPPHSPPPFTQPPSPAAPFPPLLKAPVYLPQASLGSLTVQQPADSCYVFQGLSYTHLTWLQCYLCFCIFTVPYHDCTACRVHASVTVLGLLCRVWVRPSQDWHSYVRPGAPYTRPPLTLTATPSNAHG